MSLRLLRYPMGTEQRVSTGHTGYPTYPKSVRYSYRQIRVE
jgi:hypothetical protein